jgi:hypothetical protein
MKPLIEKPFEPVMKFFKPELFLRFNSSDEEEADRADEEWEVAIRAYRDHLDELREHLPTGVKALVNLNLHDAEWLALDQHAGHFYSDRSEPVPFAVESGIGILSLKQGDRVISLFYLLWDGIKKYRPEDTWPFSKERPHWLFDEIDAISMPDGPFLHRILLSDGRVLEIPFVSCLIHNLRLEPRDDGHASKQIA